MEEKVAVKPNQGTWDNLPTAEQVKEHQEKEKKPQIKFELNKEQVVSFAEDFDKPLELPDDSSVYYLFDCKQDGEEKIFFASAWSLLRGLKELTPLAGKSVCIKKVMEAGKQKYIVTEMVGTTDKVATTPTQ